MPLDGNPAKYAEPLAPVDEDAAVLLRAAEYIERHGWCQRLFYDGASVCLVGAIRIGAGFDVKDGDFEKQMRKVDGYVRRLGFEWSMYAFDWNDSPGRTAAEVIARLRSAAGQS